ncbi:restriction endonuclease subunit S [Mannheimia haemolytica]|uniref:restriction endonuclease subunit S n=1 Tax=Mannheimia haemolytica TaxID=75985 RepID=UPI001CF3CFC4|nr:restriction endonuclease subunit S [Mannheimia haemolytica]MCB4227659.1 restriction endonuclease subunit S [Mannheimia haemolytica]
MKFEKLSYPEDWGLFSLQEVCSRITSGGTPSRKNEDFYKNGSVCWVKTKELENYYIYDTEEKITSDAIKNSSAKILPQNTILLAMYGATVGELGILSKDMACNQACCALIVNSDQFDYRYVFYLLKLHKKEIQSLATGAAQQNLSATVIRDFTFGFPILEKQKNIANILECLDKKIQLNTQTNQTLEAIAQAIFKSWFVDFDPVRAKAAALNEGKSEHEANLAAMSVICGKDTSELSDTECSTLWQIAEAFPSEFVENEEFGEVPKGWEVKKVGEIANFIKGKKPKQISNFQENEMLPHILVASLSGKYSEFAPTEKAVICQNTETLILMDGSGSGKISIGHNGVVGSTLAKLNLNNEKYWAIIHLLLKNKELDIQQHTTGTSIPHTDKTRVLNYNLIIPCDIILNWFNGYLENTLHSILTNRNKNLSLEKIRDELLPKLLSGEI